MKELPNNPDAPVPAGAPEVKPEHRRRGAGDPQRSATTTMLRWHLILLLLIAVGNFSHGGQSNYCASLLAGVNKSLPGVQRLSDPSLVDTNNTATKTRGCLFRLDSVHAGGPIGNLRLGMTLDEVIRFWGKPPQAWWNYQGGPRFDYGGVILYFASNTLSGICINSPELRELQFEPKVPSRSAVSRWQQALKSWTMNDTKNAIQLQQATNQVLLTLAFRHGDNSPLFQLCLEQCAPPLVSLPQRSLNRIGASTQAPRDKFEATILAKLAVVDQGFWWGEHKEPDPEHTMQVDRAGKSFWLVYFEFHRPVPDSGIFARVDQQTGEVEVEVE